MPVLFNLFSPLTKSPKMSCNPYLLTQSAFATVTRNIAENLDQYSGVMSPIVK